MFPLDKLNSMAVKKEEYKLNSTETENAIVYVR